MILRPAPPIRVRVRVRVRVTVRVRPLLTLRAAPPCSYWLPTPPNPALFPVPPFSRHDLALIYP